MMLDWSSFRLVKHLLLLVTVWWLTLIPSTGAGAPSCYLELFDKLQKQICRSVGPSLAASLKSWNCHQNVASLSLFYRYCFGRCSFELAQLVPLPYFWTRSNCYLYRLHYFFFFFFFLTIPRCYKDVVAISL